MAHTLSSLRAGELAGLTRLDLSCGLTHFPPEIFGLADSLEILNLSGNALSDLPADLPKLHKLRVLFCSDNRFSRVPEVLGQCSNLEMVGFKANQIRELPAAALPPKLRWLILTDNLLEELPAQLGACSRLQKLMLSGNKLHCLPDELALCTRLELLRIAANRFTRLPDWLLAMPRLAWLACAGNPFSDSGEAAATNKISLPHINWHDLELQEQLGEGASGVIYRAHLRSEPEAAPVAVKIFKGALTSDGLPRSEKVACLAAGEHPGLIPVAGKINGHPQGTPGLVMSLIDPGFQNLAGPPSLESCTRDIYPANLNFNLETVINIALGIASVAEHLHAQGLMHGDLYGHNILWNENGECLLGDFGAASFIPQQDERLTRTLERVEVRAYSCLLEELLDRCNAAPDEQSSVAAIRALQQRCDQPVVGKRPSFDEIKVNLEKLQARLPTAP